MQTRLGVAIAVAFAFGFSVAACATGGTPWDTGQDASVGDDGGTALGDGATTADGSVGSKGDAMSHADGASAKDGASAGDGSSASDGGGGDGSVTCSPCVLGSAVCSGSAVDTCQAQGSCTAYVQTSTCTAAQTCVQGRCVDTTCASGCMTPPGPVCRDANTQISFGTSGTCVNNTCSYPATLTGCAFGCAAGVCVMAPSCTPGATRCNGTQIETCNSLGSGWLFTQNCPGTCTNGLCDAPCTAGATRCNGSTVETCNASGTAWVPAATACASGCLTGACIDADLDVDGTTVTMDGEHHYANGIVVRNGGKIQVGSTGSLSLYAPMIDVQTASFITGAPGTQPCSAPPDDVANGVRLYGQQVTIDGSVTWTAGGCAQDGIVIRADSISGAGTVSAGADRNLLLYGTGGVATTLTATGATPSLMPPSTITSPTHPAGGMYNDDAPPPVFDWDKPYSAVAGYYYVAGATSATPTATSTLLGTESLALSTPAPPGFLYLDVVTLDTNGNIGTIPHEFTVLTTQSPPLLSSTTNPNPGTYSTNNAVVMAWQGGNGSNGFAYLFDHFPNTRPTQQNGTIVPANTTPQQVLLQNVQDGPWWFHMVGFDSMGYSTRAAAHYQVDIGPQPATGTIAGTVVDGNGNGVVGATVVVQRGVYTTTTTTGGVYTFGNNGIAVGTYEVVAEQSGMRSQQLTLAVTAGTTTDGNFALAQGAGCPSCSDVCSGVACAAGGTCMAGVCVAGPVLYHGWASPIAGCSTTYFNATAPTDDNGSYPYITGDSNACRAWKLAATICTTAPQEYSGTTDNWSCPNSGGFTDPTFGTFCPVANQFSCSTCPGSCNAGCTYHPLSLRNCSGVESNQN